MFLQNLHISFDPCTKSALDEKFKTLRKASLILNLKTWNSSLTCVQLKNCSLTDHGYTYFVWTHTGNKSLIFLFENHNFNNILRLTQVTQGLPNQSTEKFELEDCIWISDILKSASIYLRNVMKYCAFWN